RLDGAQHSTRSAVEVGAERRGSTPIANRAAGGRCGSGRPARRAGPRLPLRTVGGAALWPRRRLAAGPGVHSPRPPATARRGDAGGRRPRRPAALAAGPVARRPTLPV